MVGNVVLPNVMADMLFASLRNSNLFVHSSHFALLSELLLICDYV